MKCFYLTNRQRWLCLFTVLLLASCTFKKERQSPQANEATWAILPFTKVDSLNPILAAGDGSFVCPILKKVVSWEEKDVFNPAAVVRNDSVFLIYRAEDTIGKHAGTSRLGLAVSTDGLYFIRRKQPILFPDEDYMKGYEWEGGIEDPRVVESEDGTYIMTYTAYDGKVARLCIASSTNLVKWIKHGLVLQGRYIDSWSKSGATVARQVEKKLWRKRSRENTGCILETPICFWPLQMI